MFLMALLWVTMSMVVPYWAFTRSSRVRISREVLLSSAPVGSSHSSRRGFLMRARAMAARKLGRELVLVLGQAQHLQKLAEVQRAAGEVLAHLNVLLHGQVRHEIVELEHEAQLLPAVIRELLCVQAHNLLAVHHDGAAVHRVQPADAVEQGGFA